MRLITALPFVIVFVAGLPVDGTVTEQNVVVPGGFGLDHPASEEVQLLIRQLSPKITAHLIGVPGGRHIMGRVIPISYKSQLVNGVNYFVKVKAHTAHKVVYYHLRIFKTFDGEAQLIKVQGPKRHNDEITYF